MSSTKQQRVRPFRRVNLKLNNVPHAAVTHYVKNNHVTLQDYLHSLIVKDMLQKGLLKSKAKKQQAEC